jgi:hypothetical protein
MESNSADSSSESDMSDTWSVINKDPFEPRDIQTDSTVIDGDTISVDPSDGESFEVIDEEGEQVQEECK